MSSRIVKTLFALAALLGVSGCLGGPGVLISYPSLSPDNTKILMTYCAEDQPCTIAELELDNGRLRIFDNPTGAHWQRAVYSPDGERIAFDVFPLVRENEEDRESQLAIMNVDGTGFRIVTSGEDQKYGPAFSPDGKSLLYVGDVSVWPDPSLVPGKFKNDYFVLDLETGQSERRSTLHFLGPLPGQFMPDGVRFVFQSEHYYVQPRRDYKGGFADSHLLHRLQIAHEKSFGENKIFIWPDSLRDRTLIPAISRGEHSSNPSVSDDGSILFVSSTNEDDGVTGDYIYDLFLNEQGHIRRLTKLQSFFLYPQISRDGRYAVFMTDSNPREQVAGDTTLWLLDIETGDLENLDEKFRRDDGA